ncbi:unnamed protein product [Coccothraustes coccothraustes]
MGCWTPNCDHRAHLAGVWLRMERQGYTGSALMVMSHPTIGSSIPCAPLQASSPFPRTHHSKKECDKTNGEGSNLCWLLVGASPSEEMANGPVIPISRRTGAEPGSAAPSARLCRSQRARSASALHTDTHFNTGKVRDGNSTACCCDSRHLTERLLDTLQFKII